MCGMSPGLDLSDLSEGPGCAGATGFRVFDICHAVHKTSPHLRNSATAFPLLSLRARLPTQSTRLASLRARFHDFFWRLSPEGLERSTSAAAQLPEKACALLARVCTGRHFTAVESNVRVGYFSTGMVFADLRPRKNDGIESPTQQTGGRTRRPRKEVNESPIRDGQPSSLLVIRRSLGCSRNHPGQIARWDPIRRNHYRGRNRGRRLRNVSTAGTGAATDAAADRSGNSESGIARRKLPRSDADRKIDQSTEM
jgi:hypothetical protein